MRGCSYQASIEDPQTGHLLLQDGTWAYDPNNAVLIGSDSGDRWRDEKAYDEAVIKSAEVAEEIKTKLRSGELVLLWRGCGYYNR